LTIRNFKVWNQSLPSFKGCCKLKTRRLSTWLRGLKRCEVIPKLWLLKTASLRAPHSSVWWARRSLS
jgi:hypothetical protein